MSPIRRFIQAALLSLLMAGSLMGHALANEKVNINTADAATLERVLINIGPSKADAIVAHRKANGPFKSMEQLALVKGVGLKTVEKNRDRIVVGAPKAAAAAPANAKPAAARPATAAKR